MGVVILFFAMTLSACMGLYTEEIYKTYGPQWRENLFYSHMLSLPLFLPFASGLVRQFKRLAESPPITIPVEIVEILPSAAHANLVWPDNLYIPTQLAYLALNVLTQYACIRGVNLLAATSSALTVVIVLNVRKLVSLLLSIWLFGNQLSSGTLVGAVVVFSAGGIYSLSGKPNTKPAVVKRMSDNANRNDTSG
jgi:solute carrier family 35 (UDP-xylose/UDP-N-acetylglucosamine transporter), member B4